MSSRPTQFASKTGVGTTGLFLCSNGGGGYQGGTVDTGQGAAARADTGGGHEVSMRNMISGGVLIPEGV